MSNLSKLVGTLCVCCCPGLLIGCHNKKEDTMKDDKLDATVPKVDPTLCDTNGKNVQTFDLNKDNKPDVWRLYKTEDEGGTKVEFMTCEQVDFDHDGKWDMSAIYDPKTGVIAEVERDTDFDGKFDVKEIYDSAGQLVSVRRDRNGDGKPDVWEQYKDGVLIAILYDDDFDGSVDRREEIPGAHPKVEMPTTADPTATQNINKPSDKTPPDK